MINAYCQRLMGLRNLSDEVVLLPYTLSVVDCFFLWQALGERKLLVEGHDSISEAVLRSAFDLYELDRGIDAADVSLVVADCPGAFIHWDRETRFVAVGGGHEFCAKAVPYPQEVRKHYFLEGALLTMSDVAAQRAYSDLIKRPRVTRRR